jgi:hypothetical protein
MRRQACFGLSIPWGLLIIAGLRVSMPDVLLAQAAGADQFTALPFTALPFTALPFTALPFTALPFTALPFTALPSSLSFGDQKVVSLSSPQTITITASTGLTGDFTFALAGTDAGDSFRPTLPKVVPLDSFT